MLTIETFDLLRSQSHVDYGDLEHSLECVRSSISSWDLESKIICGLCLQSHISRQRELTMACFRMTSDALSLSQCSPLSVPIMFVAHSLCSSPWRDEGKLQVFLHGAPINSLINELIDVVISKPFRQQYQCFRYSQMQIFYI